MYMPLKKHLTLDTKIKLPFHLYSTEYSSKRFLVEVSHNLACPCEVGTFLIFVDIALYFRKFNTG